MWYMTDVALQICCKRTNYSIKWCPDNLCSIIEMVKIDPYLILCTKMKYSGWVIDKNVETKTGGFSRKYGRIFLGCQDGRTFFE